MASMSSFLAANASREGCWNWTGWKDRDGYGRTKYEGKTSIAHRVAYILAYGSIQPGMNVCHSCDNPACCRPDHLFLGTQKDNCQDAKRKDRHSRGERNGGAKLTDAYVREIRASKLTQVALAKKYGVTQSTIWEALRGRKWAHVQD